MIICFRESLLELHFILFRIQETKAFLGNSFRKTSILENSRLTYEEFQIFSQSIFCCSFIDEKKKKIHFFLYLFKSDYLVVFRDKL